MRLSVGRDRTGNVGQAAEARDRSSRLAGQEPADCVSERWTDDAAVGDEAGDEARRGHVKGCVIYRRLLGALERRAPRLVPMYRVMSGRLVETARRRGLDEKAVKTLRTALAASSDQ